MMLLSLLNKKITEAYTKFKNKSQLTWNNEFRDTDYRKKKFDRPTSLRLLASKFYINNEKLSLLCIFIQCKLYVLKNNCFTNYTRSSKNP